ncbi:MAG: PQQ-dependent sugar dehydrogenase, partial [bacterium]|nr:PQQ-dependent sugar dehydrogenase [Candidatus Kapabacteria bacterium]
MKILLVLLSLLFSASVSAQTFLETRVVTDGLIIPWEILWGPDNWLWVTERPGRVSRVNPETGEKRELLSLPNDFAYAEVGMLGMALHPSFATAPYVYIADAYRSDSMIYERVVRYWYAIAADTLFRDRVMIDSIRADVAHGGCRLMFGPDTTLYFTIGETGKDPFAAPSHESILGKTLRINPDGTVPKNNPWPSYRWPTNLIWTVGHRNSQGLAFAPDGTLYATEHGPDANDEINILQKGRSFGWPYVQGICDNEHDPEETRYCRDSNVVEPIFSFTPTVAPTGVVYYDHPRIDEWRNSLLVTTLGIVASTPERPTLSLIQLKLSDDGRSVGEMKPWFSNVFGRLRDLCIAPDGRVFMAMSNRDARHWPSYEKFPSDLIIEIKPPVDSAWVTTTFADTISLCASDSFDVPFKAGGNFRTGNRIVVELSDATGSFAHRTIIGSFDSFGGDVRAIEGVIDARIPDSIASSGRYRIRVVTTRPYRFSDAAASAVAIHARPNPTIQQDAGILRTTPGFLSYRWSIDGELVEADGEMIEPRRSGMYTVRVVDSLGCSGASVAIDVVVTGIAMPMLPRTSVRVYPSPARSHVTIDAEIVSRGSISVAITDVNGARVLARRRDAESGKVLWDIPLGELAPGFYLL